MMKNWRCTLHVKQQEAKLLLTVPEQGDLLKARLPVQPSHPRALLTMLEGLSLWSGRPLCVALRVDDHYHHMLASPLLGDELWPAESALVQFECAPRASRQLRLAGIGDFRDLRKEAL